MNFLIRKFSLIISIGSLLLLIYIFYKSEIFWEGNNRGYYRNYYLISSIFILFSIYSYFINDKIKEYLIIFGLTIVFSLYLFEGYLTYKNFSKQNFYKNLKLSKIQLYEKQTDKKWDKRDKFEIYYDLKKKNKNIAVNFHASYIVKRKNLSFPILPFSGLSNSETIHCNENGYYSIYKSDRYGFNNPDEEWDKKEIEYLVVGDSFVHGACVNRPNDISSVLRNLSNKSVLNLGISGNGPLIEYATLREYLNNNVKKVLWVYFDGNDFSDLNIEKENNILINYLKDLNFTQNLKLKQNEINDIVHNITKKKEIGRNIFKFELIRFIKIYNTRTSIFSLPEPEMPKSEFKKILQLVKELTDKNDTKLFFVYLPEYSYYKSNYGNKNYNLIKNIVKELKIPFIDIHKDILETEQNPLKLYPFEISGHFNVIGYKKVAETIYKFTKN